MRPVTDDTFAEEQRGAQVFQVDGPLGPMTYAIDDRNMIFLNGDIHPMGQAGAMERAMENDVEWISTGAVATYYPAAWLIAECMGDAQRLAIIDGLLAFVARTHA